MSKKLSWQASDEKWGVYQTYLENGLKVLAVERRHLPVVTTMLSYQVGGVHTFQGKSGLAHFLEHMMFKGSKKFVKGEIDRITQRLGGMNNAYTTTDYTCYYFTFASDRWEKALEIEADRMANCDWSQEDFASEKKVILEELASSEDSPLEMLDQHLEALSFWNHPYRNPIIGWRQEIENLTSEELRQFYKTFYVPSNAVLIVVGDIIKERVAAMVNKFFGNIAAQPSPSEPFLPPEMIDKRNLHAELVQEVEVPRFQILFPTCQVGTREDYILDIIDIILSHGRSSRLYRRLVAGEKLVQAAGSFNDTRKYAGLFMITGESYPETPLPQIEKVVFEELNKLAERPVSKYELLKARNVLLADSFFQQETTHELASELTQIEMLSPGQTLTQILDIRQSITPQDVKRVAKKYLDPSQALIGWSLPKSPVPRHYSTTTGKSISLRGIRLPSDEAKIDFVPEGGLSKISEIKEHVFANGLRLLFWETKHLPIVATEVFVDENFCYEKPEKAGTACLMRRLLLEGTKKRGGPGISSLLEATGSYLSAGSSRISLRSLTKDFDLITQLLAEILSQPLFAPNALEEEKKKALHYLRSRKDSSTYQAKREFLRLLYGTHPLARSPIGNEQTLGQIQVADICEYHEKFFRPNNTVIAVVGNYPWQKTLEIMEKYFGKWKQKEIEFPKLPKVKRQHKARQKFIKLAKQQLSIYWGHLGITRYCPDYHALLVLDHILGVGAGFTDRLSKKMRDELGLVYDIWGSITASAGSRVGAFTTFLATDPKNFQQAMNILREEIVSLQEGDVSEEEIINAKAFLTGNYMLAFETNTALAEYLLSAHHYDLGYNYLQYFPEMIRQVDKQAVVAAAQKYLFPDTATTVVSGPIDQID